MEKKLKRQMAEPIRGFRLPRYAEIPTVGLYLEQTIKYINGFLAPLGCLELTGSMVSNYVKKGLIPAPVKKQYFHNSAHKVHNHPAADTALIPAKNQRGHIQSFHYHQ